MNTFGTENHHWFKGMSSTDIHSTTLPTQTVSESVKRTKKFQQDCMDALEAEGVVQLAENSRFNDYYKMLKGKLAWADYGIEDNDIISQVRSLGDKVDVPIYVKHYDIIGIIIRKLSGEWLKQKANFKVNSTADEISENDFLRELTRRSEEWLMTTFNKEIEAVLIKDGINPTTGEDFESEEERQAYLQKVEEVKAKAIPPDVIQRELSKNFKTIASEWAQHTLEKDSRAFFEDEMDLEEAEDFFTTGRYFRHYHVGYDYYKPERWDTREVFFSKDLDIRYPQDAEYVGRVTLMSANKITERFGHLMTPAQIKKINEKLTFTTNDSKAKNWRDTLADGFFGHQRFVPFKNYFDYDLALKTQEAFDMPMGETLIDTHNGTEKIPTWLSPFQTNYFNNHVVGREDFSRRTDVLQVTEAYWKSWKKMWFLNYTDTKGVGTSEIVTDDLLKEFIEEHNIKKVSSKSLQDLQREELEDNTMYEFWLPEFWKGVKINAGNSFIGEDFYLGVEPLAYQIKGESNLFDVKPPVTGIISDSLADLLRPYQVGYNICLNQIFNLLSKEMGMFFLFDINFLPSDYKDSGTIEDSLEKIQQLAKDVGVVPIDSQKQNIQGAQNMNTFMVQDVTFDKQINSRVQLSNYYFQKALEQIGFTPQRLGGATTYETATGVQQGMEAQYDQTAGLFMKLTTAKLKSMEMHLSIAQYCQKEFIDKDFIFTGTDNDKTYINLTDPDFPFRRFGLIANNSPNERRILEQVRNYLLSNNTLGGDLLDFASAMATDTLSELIDISRRSRIEREKEAEKQKQHEQQLLDKQLQAQAEEKQAERDFKASEAEKDRETKLEAEHISALGRASDKQSNVEGYEQINKAAQESIQNNFKERELNVKESLAESKSEIEREKIANISRNLELQADKMQKDYELKKEALRTSRENAIRNSIDKNLKN